MKTKALIAGAAFSLATYGANAQFLTSATVQTVGCDASNTCFINLANAPLTACSNATQIRWDGSTAQGKSFLATALTAKAAEIAVNVGTTEVCNGDFDQLNFITLN